MGHWVWEEDTETRGHGDTGKEEDRGTKAKTYCKFSPCLPISLSPRPRVPASPHSPCPNP
ncbi:MAG: hypothetical protein RMY29_030260 [Nostoc sp. CreGUA01]|nr:hypothetical protein [Nostoc sp. CreGUA01]